MWKGANNSPIKGIETAPKPETAPKQNPPEKGIEGEGYPQQFNAVKVTHILEACLTSFATLQTCSSSSSGLISCVECSWRISFVFVVLHSCLPVAKRVEGYSVDAWVSKFMGEAS